VLKDVLGVLLIRHEAVVLERTIGVGRIIDNDLTQPDLSERGHLGVGALMRGPGPQGLPIKAVIVDRASVRTGCVERERVDVSIPSLVSRELHVDRLESLNDQETAVREATAPCHRASLTPKHASSGLRGNSFVVPRSSRGSFDWLERVLQRSPS